MARAPAAQLRPRPDEAMIRLIRALARQAAREDHERESRDGLNKEGQVPQSPGSQLGYRSPNWFFQMKRAAIYARFSTDMQNERSIEDQVALCDYAARQNLAVVATFEDRALSGASLRNRPGIQELLVRAKTRGFEAIIVESMSRVGRDQEDRAAIRKRLKSLGSPS
jgi:hypothetical protein